MRRIQRPSLYVVCALIALLLTGCGATSPQRVQSAPQPTETPVPELTWTPVTLPDGLSIADAGWAVSPVDGHDAWLCAQGSAGQFAVWATQDAGVRWRQVGGFSYKTSQAASCSLVADETSARSLVATLSWGSGEAGTLQDASVYSSDGGAHWSHAPVIAEIATSAASAIALMGRGLAVSADGFRTWRVLPSAPLASGDSFFHFWVAANSSTLLAASYNNTLWRTDDLGAQWTKVPTPNGQTSLVVWLKASHTFYMCGGSDHPPIIQCSGDMGAHWSSVPAITQTTPCSKCGVGVTTQTTGCSTTAIAPDGSLLTICWGTTTWQRIGDIYRLPPHSGSWQRIGATPEPFDLVPATGPVWSTPDVAPGTMDTTTLPF
ncbi:MAG TPA: hypothetical protein VFN78_06770 [Ktedonobacterales bacterium]|nr:hypothetical protein [Ktedonobacterales bacterium]